MEGPWNGGPAFIRMADPELGLHPRWNLADLGKLPPARVVAAVEATTGSVSVVQVSSVFAWFPTAEEYQQMTQ
eukprot:5640082-Pyramimonas_sp.AAC.1